MLQRALTSEDSIGSATTDAPRLGRSGRLHWYHWLVLLLSLAATLAASFVTRHEIDEKVEANFDRQSEQAVSLILERLQKYEDGLWGGVAAIEANGGDIDYGEWKTFAASLDIDHRYPGINGIGVIHSVAPSEFDAYLSEQQRDRPDFDVHPSHDEEIFLPISYIEPSAPNAEAVGLDMAHERNRFDGVKRAREFGSAQMTGPITLVQDAMSTPGFLLFAPWYENGDPGDVDQRRADFSGVVYAPFIVSTLMDGALDEAERQVGISITDSDVVLFDEHRAEIDDFDPNPLYQRSIRVPLYGRQWTFDVWSAQSFRDASQNNEPLTILIGGLLLDVVLFALFRSLTGANRRAVEFADQVTEELREKTARLERSNGELEQFAYVASHDLKTPLRGIGDLTEFLREDLADYLESDDADPRIEHHLDRLGQQSQRMSALVTGILDYSRVGGTGVPPAGRIDLDAYLPELAGDLGVRSSQIVSTGTTSFDAPAAVHLEQVLQNLITNAIIHHHDAGAAHIVVTVERTSGRFVISVSDDGPGIDPRHHERIFQVFQRLGGSSSEGTGIGLSIVKKIIEGLGCSIAVSSPEGTGTTFTFTWPVESARAGDRVEAATHDADAAQQVPV